MGSVPEVPVAPVVVIGHHGHAAEPSRCGQTPLDFTARVNRMKKMTELSPFTESLGTSRRAAVVVTEVDIWEYRRDFKCSGFSTQGGGARNL